MNELCFDVIKTFQNHMIYYWLDKYESHPLYDKLQKGRQVTQAICGEKGNAMSFTLALLNQLISKLIKA